MEITKYSDYAMRVLIYLAKNQNRITSMGEIANFFNISKEHLRKVVHQLSTLNYISSYKGRNGGLQLKQAPHTIRIGQIIREMEKRTTLVNCDGIKACQFSPDCYLKGYFASALEAFFDKLNEYTLQDIIDNPLLSNHLAKPNILITLENTPN